MVSSVINEELSPIIAVTVFSLGFAYICYFMVKDHLALRRVKSMLRAREDLSDSELDEMFVGLDSDADRLASRCRAVLAANLGLPAEKILPDDRLNEDLNTELKINPHLFWELQTEFGVYDEDDEEFTELHEFSDRVVTVRDVIEFMGSKINRNSPEATG